MPAMSRVHREVLAHVPRPVRAVFLDTTAGYETNVEVITAKAVEYYALRLQTELHVASFRHSRLATVAETARAVAELRAANLIFAGPGSPSYALEHLRDTPVWEAVMERFRQGAHLLFASAAAITLGCYALPVYEVYKAGRDPFWMEGLDALGKLGLRLAVVPHFDDNSGGANYDSRFCYMGAARFDALQAQLPDDVTILGIDEYTAARFDARQEQVHVFGQGTVTVIVNGSLTRFGGGSTIPFGALRSSHREIVPTPQRPVAELGYEFAESGKENGALHSLAEFVEALPLDAATRVELLARLETAAADGVPGRQIEEHALLDLVLELRDELRRARRWELADKARDVLVRLGYEVRDTPEGSTWRRAQ
jgi:hypothetical protein